MCNGSGRFGSRLKETGTLLLQAEATLIWGTTACYLPKLALAIPNHSAIVGKRHRI